MRHYALEQRNLYFGILTAFADGASEIRLLITYPLFASSLQCFVTVLAESYAISVGSRTTICSALNHFSGIPKLLCQAHSLIRPGPKKPGQVTVRLLYQLGMRDERATCSPSIILT